MAAQENTATPGYPYAPPQEPPPAYENWLPENDEYKSSPYNNPLTVGLITSQPVPEFRPQPPQPHTIVIMPVTLGHNSSRMSCPHCLADISTNVRREPHVMAYVSCVLLCVFGFWPCCCIPFCMDSCQESEHSCPNCNKFIGRRA